MTVRVIGRLDIKGANLIKGIHLEGLRVVGDPREFSERYYHAGIDELLFIDVVASLYGRNSLLDTVRRTAEKIFVPLTVGGGIRTLDDVRQALRSGADKVAINTAAVQNPELISEVASRFGSQCMVLSIEAKVRQGGGWEVFTDNGREHTGLDVVEWAKRGVELGAGEILLTSVDREGTRKGYDIELIRAVSDAIPIPVIASGGLGSSDHAVRAVIDGGAMAVAIADAFHYQRIPILELKQVLGQAGIEVRL